MKPATIWTRVGGIEPPAATPVTLVTFAPQHPTASHRGPPAEVREHPLDYLQESPASFLTSFFNVIFSTNNLQPFETPQTNHIMLAKNLAFEHFLHRQQPLANIALHREPNHYINLPTVCQAAVPLAAAYPL